MKEILIVESPTKAKTISKILRGGMKVLSTKGHIKDLPKTKLGVKIENNFEPTYIIIKGKGKIVREIKREAKKAEMIYLGCDPDREGEAIAFHIAEEIDGDKEIKRVLFYEITKEGIKRALENPGTIDLNKVNSHKARRVLDRLVGYLVSPILWRIFRNRSLSAGRVQTVALRLIVEREKEIETFVPERYFVLTAIFARKNGEKIKFCLEHRKEGERIRNEDEAKRLKETLQELKEINISKIFTEIKNKSPLPPFITASLQQEAARKLLFPSKKTMFLAQRLFEGIDLKEERTGLITYPRTDSKRVADEFIQKEREFIRHFFGEEYLPERVRHYKDRRDTQGAHEAIRPTDLEKRPELIKDYLDADSYKLYDLIFRRAVASQMADSRYEERRIEIALPQLEDYLLVANGRKRIFDGFEKILPSEEREVILPELKEGEKVNLVEVLLEERATQPPPRYTEASLIKKLEVNGIGRPSTYAVIISTLFERKYVEKKNGKLYPTELGRKAEEILVNNFSSIFEINFTRKMEEELDLIEEKSKEWQEVVREFYLPFVNELKKSEENIPKMREDLREELPEKCPICGRNLVYQWGRFGKFIACSGYPECQFVKKEEKEFLEERCPNCGRQLVKRIGKKGEFIACSGYPECKFIKKEELKLLPEKCPNCGKNLVERRGRFGKFIACSGYPECQFKKRKK